MGAEGTRYPSGYPANEGWEPAGTRTWPVGARKGQGVGREPSPVPKGCMAPASTSQDTSAAFHGQPVGLGNANPPQGSFHQVTRGHEWLPGSGTWAEAERRGHQRHRGGDLRLVYSLEELLPLQRDTSTNCIRLAHLLLLLRPCFVGKLEGRPRERELSRASPERPRELRGDGSRPQMQLCRSLSASPIKSG